MWMRIAGRSFGGMGGRILGESCFFITGIMSFVDGREGEVRGEGRELGKRG